MSHKRNAQNARKERDFVNNPSNDIYSRFDAIDGSHDFKTAVPNGYVDYRARTRHGGEVFFFNFGLAKEMGLIDASHSNEMTEALRKKILYAFSIVIINEYDIAHERKFNAKDVREKSYMATRYLQLQHPNKQGKTSGDGRGIWNGQVKHRGVTWDITSSGTGATKLSPAHAITKQFFKTGDRAVGYGNGYNCVNDGLSAALMSDMFHQNGIETERTLAIISFPGGSSINVRAGKNLFRPAHFFHQLKQNNISGLKASVDFFIDRQIANGDSYWLSRFRGRSQRYADLAEYMALTFSRTAAQFEAEYIFCWLDWDGDNILANGGIIDYGSVRQFGLYHWEYRYDDVERMSTNIPEQRRKARQIVQNFAQIRDFLKTGKKQPLRNFQNDRILKLFDQNFRKVLNELILTKVGFSKKESRYLWENSRGLVEGFKKVHSYFERTKSKKGVYKIDDGITADAIFCMKDLHRELPKHLLNSSEGLTPNEFVELMKSSYARPRDLELSPYRAAQTQAFQQLYLKLMNQVAREFHRGNLRKTLLACTMRASLNNHGDRITGDGVLALTSSLIRNNHRLRFEQKITVIEQVMRAQSGKPVEQTQDESTDKLVERNLKAIHAYREGF